MPGFNFLFEAFILLMGLAMAEVLRGFSRVLKLRARRRAGIETGSIRIGWLTPLLGLFVIVDQSTFFLHMYGFRETMPFNGGTVLGILLTIGWYYLIARQMTPYMAMANLVVVPALLAMIWLFFSKNARVCIAMLLINLVLTLAYGALMLRLPMPG